MKENKNYDDYLALIRKGELTLRDVPKEYLTKEICREAVASCIYNIFYIPSEFEEEGIWTNLAMFNPYTLNAVPLKFRNVNLYLCTLKQNRDCEGKFSYIFKNIPEELKDEYFYLKLFEIESNKFIVLKYIPKEYITREMYLLACIKNPVVLDCYYIEELIDDQFFIDLIKCNNSALKYIPTHLITKEMCINAVKCDGMTLKYVPEHLRDHDIYLNAAIQNPLALQFVSSAKDLSEKLVKEILKNMD